MTRYKPATLTSSHLSSEEIGTFCALIWTYFGKNRRIFPWRYIEDPYAVLVSEIMLQQTQTHRVLEKYVQFIAQFPNFSVLAQASLRDVLACWQGLGYNRRALYLHKIAQKVVTEYDGQLPENPFILETFPGLGVATAASVCVFAFNKPYAFIETNIRAVFIQYFFLQDTIVSDKQLMPLVEQTMDLQAPRDWFYALMDYGVMIKKLCANPSRKSAHYTKQSKFEGSDRQIRGAIVRHLIAKHQINIDELKVLLKTEDERLRSIIDDLCKEGFARFDRNILMLD